MVVYLDAPDEIFAFENILRDILNFDKFNQWLKKEGIDFDKYNLFEGYRFFIETSLRCLISEITDDFSLGLEGDDIFRRADFRGESIFQLPNSSEKTKIIKYLALILKDIAIPKNLGELLKKCEPLTTFLNKIKKIYDNSTLKKEVKIDKGEMLKYLSLYWTYISLIDNQRGVPQGHYHPLLKSGLTSEKMKNSLKGFQYSLKYIIESNYGSLKGKRLNDLTISETLFKKKDLVDPFEDENEKSEEYKDILNWRSIDRFHSVMQKEIIDSLEKEIGENFGMNRFFVIKEVNKNELINEIKGLPSPKYLELKDKKSVFKKLDLNFLFYSEFEILDSERRGIFNGVPAFIYTAKGFAISKEEKEIDEPVKIIRFVHPEKGVNGNNYSYAVLIESYGSLADYSGWLVFYDCCGDYSGFSGSQHAQAESFLKSYSKMGLVEIQEFKVELNYFKEYLAKKVSRKVGMRSFDEEMNYLEKSSNKTNLESEMSNAKGLLMELIVYYLHSKKKPLPKKIDWHVKYDPDFQFDVVFNVGNKITFCECKWSKDNKNNLREKALKIINNEKFKEEWGDFEEKNVEMIYFSFVENENERRFKEKKGYTVLTVGKSFNRVYPEFEEHIKRFKQFSKGLKGKT